MPTFAAVPQDPSVAARVEQATLWPSSSEQLHAHGPLPLTALALPLAHRLSAGAWNAAASAALPQATGPAGFAAGWALSAAVQPTVVPPSAPAQFQFHGPNPVTRLAEP